MTTTGIKTVVFPVRDLAAAKALFAAIAGEPEIDESYYVGWNFDGLNIGLDPNGHRNGIAHPVAYWQVDDIQAALRALHAVGAEPQQEPRDVGGGMLVARVKDSDGNLVGLMT